jgi:hypothetical protein
MHKRLFTIDIGNFFGVLNINARSIALGIYLEWLMGDFVRVEASLFVFHMGLYYEKAYPEDDDEL